MKTSATWAIAAILAAAAGAHGPCFAAEKGAPAAANPLAALDANAIPAADLGKQSARGTTTIEVTSNTTNNTENIMGIGGNGSAFGVGNLRDNSVSGTSTTGTITAGTDAIHNNMGMTFVINNTGNNSLVQQSVAVNITMH